MREIYLRKLFCIFPWTKITKKPLIFCFFFFFFLLEESKLFNETFVLLFSRDYNYYCVLLVEIGKAIFKGFSDSRFEWETKTIHNENS